MSVICWSLMTGDGPANSGQTLIHCQSTKKHGGHSRILCMITTIIIKVLEAILDELKK